MARRWICPQCGSGVNAPERPRKNDVRRYCLKCSADTGVLVERTVPALERKRSAAKAAIAERGKHKQQVELAKRMIATVDAAGNEHLINVHKELRRALKSMGFFDNWAYGQRPTMKDFDITIRRRARDGSTGQATQRGFWVTFTFGTGHESALELIYHEAAHMANQAADHHGPKFRRVLAQALQERWPFIHYGRTDAGRVYDADQRVVDQMKQHILAGGQL